MVPYSSSFSHPIDPHFPFLRSLPTIGTLLLMEKAPQPAATSDSVFSAAEIPPKYSRLNLGQCFSPPSKSVPWVNNSCDFWT